VPDPPVALRTLSGSYSTLLSDQGLFACLRCRLAAGYVNLSLTKQYHYVLWRMLLSSCPSWLLSYQLLAHQLVQKVLPR
jgi:hypothetical protein